MLESLHPRPLDRRIAVRIVPAIATARSRTDARIVAVAEGGTDRPRERTGADAVIDPETALADATVAALLGSDGSNAQSSASAPSHRG